MQQNQGQYNERPMRSIGDRRAVEQAKMVPPLAGGIFLICGSGSEPFGSGKNNTRLLGMTFNFLFSSHRYMSDFRIFELVIQVET
ncbi:MAG: hypothetical protein MUP22_16335 [Desulfobacterales bacterium]|nr:hypothetical protein [Desulfobacterales bacterium]